MEWLRYTEQESETENWSKTGRRGRGRHTVKTKRQPSSEHRTIARV